MRPMTIKLICTFICLLVTDGALADNNLHVAQRWCADGSFQFLVEGSGPSLPGPYETCVTLSSDGMRSADSIRFNRKVNAPVGNFVDYILKNILGRNDISHRDLRLGGPRKYLVRAGSCLSNQFFSVEISFPYLPANNVNPARAQCQFEQSIAIESDLPLAGVYPRARGQSVQNFISDLMK